ncbi:MAG: tRNA modification GTPase, partial [Asticcacaulis sp.]
QMDGGLRRRYEAWRGDLLDILARLEVFIDFPDEDLPDELSTTILQSISVLEAELGSALTEAERGRQIREGYRIVSLGEPNAGKSSLFNALLRAETAIVTPIAGTTRDVIEAQLRIGPYSVLLYDTAGLRDTDEVVEREGIRRARLRAEEADLRIWVVDASTPREPDPALMRADDIIIVNKCDLAPGVSRETSSVTVSTTTGEGVDHLTKMIEHKVTQTLSGQTFPAATRERHRQRLEAARRELDLAMKSRLRVPELTAEHVRAALNSFDALFGRYDVENVLDIVFSTFCIGK